MVEGDIPQIVAIEHESFPTTWPQTAYRRELSNNIARYLVVIDEAHAPLAAEEAPPRRSFLDLFRRNRSTAPATTAYLVGYIGLWLMVDDAHVVAVAVREAYRGRGIGELLLAEAIDLAMHERMESVTLEVRKSNLLAQALYEKYRFLKVGVRKRYYSDNHEDAIIMTTPPIQHESYREHMRYLRGLREERNYAERADGDVPLGSAEEPE
jgi:[ribosomal protein S18]-alanine N-acetyltransferase